MQSIKFLLAQMGISNFGTRLADLVSRSGDSETFEGRVPMPAHGCAARFKFRTLADQCGGIALRIPQERPVHEKLARQGRIPMRVGRARARRRRLLLSAFLPCSGR